VQSWGGLPFLSVYPIIVFKSRAVEVVKKLAANPRVMLRGAKHLDGAMTYVIWRFFASLRMTRGKGFFTSSAVLATRGQKSGPVRKRPQCI